MTSRTLADLVAHPVLHDDVVRPLHVHRAPAVSRAALRRLPLAPSTVPVAALHALPTAAGTVSDLAAPLR